MSDPILDRLRKALLSEVEHPIPSEVFTPFPRFNEATMEVAGDITDNEIRLIKLFNELGYESIRIQNMLEDPTSKMTEVERENFEFELICNEMYFSVIGRLLTVSNVTRLGKSNDGAYAIASNGKVVRVKMPGPVTH